MPQKKAPFHLNSDDLDAFIKGEWDTGKETAFFSSMQNTVLQPLKESIGAMSDLSTSVEEPPLPFSLETLIPPPKTLSYEGGKRQDETHVSVTPQTSSPISASIGSENFAKNTFDETASYPEDSIQITAEKSPIQSSELFETSQKNLHVSDMESPEESSNRDASTGFKKVSSDELEKGLKQRNKKIQDLFSDKGTVS